MLIECASGYAGYLFGVDVWATGVCTHRMLVYVWCVYVFFLLLIILLLLLCLFIGCVMAEMAKPEVLFCGGSEEDQLELISNCLGWRWVVDPDTGTVAIGKCDTATGGWLIFFCLKYNVQCGSFI